MVDEETKSIKNKSKWPIIMMVGLGISVPVIIYLSSKASYSMRSSSKKFDEQALSLNLERRKTDGLLSQLLPADIISMLKTGKYGKYPPLSRIRLARINMESEKRQEQSLFARTKKEKREVNAHFWLGQ